MTQTKRYFNGLVTRMSKQLVISIDITYKYYYLYINPSTNYPVLYSSYIFHLVHSLLDYLLTTDFNNLQTKYEQISEIAW